MADVRSFAIDVQVASVAAGDQIVRDGVGKLGGQSAKILVVEP